MSTAIQLSFTLRTTPGVRTLHLLGSWDNYQNQLPMSLDPSKAAGSGAWVGTFKFQPGTLTPGQRYWYYYIMDGYHVTHDPAQTSVVEPTTQRKLNILDIPGSGGASYSSSGSKRHSTSSKRGSRRLSVDVAKGRSLSPSQIKSPKPYKPGQTSHIVNYDMQQLEYQFAHASINEESDSDDSYDGSDVSSNVPSLTSRSSNSSSPSSLSSGSSCGGYCTCERYGITRSGNRIKLDCGGKRCGYGYENGSSCSSESEEEVYHAKATRRHGVVVRGR